MAQKKITSNALKAIATIDALTKFCCVAASAQLLLVPSCCCC